MAKMEKGFGFKNAISDFFKQVSIGTIGSGIIAAVFGFSAGLVYMQSVSAAGMEPELVKAFVTSTFAVSGIFAILYPLYYRKPINFANSIPAAVVFASLLPHYTVAELMAGGVISGILVLLLGATGIIKKVMEFIPNAVVMGMIGGVFLKFTVNMITPIATVPVIALLMIAAYFVCSKWVPKIPGVLASLLVGIIALAITGIDLPELNIAFRLPTFLMPDFLSPRLFNVVLAWSIPLTLLVIGAENAQAYGVLVTEKYDPPINSMTVWSGIGGIVSSLFVLHNTNVAGPMTAICASPDNGEKDHRWTGSVVQGLVWVLVSPIYASFATFLQHLPPYFINIVVGLAIFKVISSSLAGAFNQTQHKFSAPLAFFIGVSGISLLGITAPFWALVGGMLVYFIFERTKKPVAA